MQLNDLIKSNVFLISIYVGLITLIALIIFIVRNRAKKKALNNLDIEPDEIDLDDSEGIVSIQKLKDKDHLLDTVYSNNFTERFKGRFIVFNKMREDDSSLDLKIKHSPKIAKIYEATNSKLMFKYNPHPENANGD